MEKFNNPVMPMWLQINLRLSFLSKNVEHIKGYQKLWEDIQSDEQ